MRQAAPEPSRQQQPQQAWTGHAPVRGEGVADAAFDNSAQLTAQRATLAKIERSPLQVSQRRRIAALQRMAAGFLVEGDAAPGPGQVHKDQFIESLKAGVRQMAQETLAKIGQGPGDCPYIAFWFQFYAGKDAAHIEQAVGRYAPEALEAANWQECVALVTERVRRGFEQHVATGSLEGVPEELPKLTPERKPGPPVQAVAQLCGTGGGGPAPMTELQRAVANFRNSQTINYTDIRYQFFGSVAPDLGGGPTVFNNARAAPLDHVVNKWERAAGGEALPNYAATGGAASGPEARHMELDPNVYRHLPARQKMQFAVLDHKRDGIAVGGWGNSYFVITPQKCVNDGFIHFGDSGETGFPGGKGAYALFEQRLAVDAEARGVLAGTAEQAGWIEVNLRGGVDLPQDISKVVVSNAELGEVAPHAGGLAAARQALVQAFGTVEYKA